EPGVLAADPDVALHGHVRAGTGGRAVHHRDRRLPDERDLANDLRITVEEALPLAVRVVLARSAVAREELTVVLVLLRPLRVVPGAEATADPGQDDDPNVRVVIAAAHVLHHLGGGAAILRGAQRRVHAVGAVELDPEDPVVVGFVQQPGD